MSFYQPRDYVIVSNGRSNGRSSYQSLMNGRVTITGTDDKGRKFSRVVEIDDGEIMDNKLRVDGKVTHHIAYGRFETEVTPAGRNVTRFHKGSGKGRHGKSVRHCNLFGHEAVVHSWYKIGRLVRQKAVYDNGKLAYDWRGSKCDTLIVHERHPLLAGEERYCITGELDIQGYIGGNAFTDAYRQGEILFFKLADNTLRVHPRAVRVENGVIRTGEKEGHQHKVEGDGSLSLFPDMLAPTPGETQEQPSQGVVEVGKGGAKVTHPEHGDVKLPTGKYIVQTQKEAVGKNKHQSVKD